jgi:hypothetical protein
MGAEVLTMETMDPRVSGLFRTCAQSREFRDSKALSTMAGMPSIYTIAVTNQTAELDSHKADRQ